MRQFFRAIAVVAVVFFVPVAALAQVERVDLTVEGMT